MRTDGAGEFIFNVFSDFCKERGIVRQVTVFYSSVMNGVAENKNQVLQYYVKIMFLYFNLGKQYWVKAVDIVNYLVNKLFFSVIGG